jgi:heme/copper-type cytochrome/quinol oxidase subunit 2
VSEKTRTILDMITNFSINATCDSIHPWQLGFQDPATPIAMGIVDLHHDVMSPLVMTPVLVPYPLSRVAVPFRHDKNNFVKIVHGKVIEIV